MQKRFSWPISADFGRDALAATQARSAHSRNSWASMSWMRTSIPNLEMNIGQGVRRRNARNMGPKPVFICKVGEASLCLNLYSTFGSAIVFKTIHYQGIPGYTRVYQGHILFRNAAGRFCPSQWPPSGSSHGGGSICLKIRFCLMNSCHS